MTGKAKVSTILIFTLGDTKQYGTLDYAIPGFFFPTPLGIAKSNAMYDALGKFKNADKVIDPKWEIKTSGIPLLFTTYEVTVSARAIQFTGPSPYK